MTNANREAIRTRIEIPAVAELAEQDFYYVRLLSSLHCPMPIPTTSLEMRRKGEWIQ
jgi:hypothetical protein